MSLAEQLVMSIAENNPMKFATSVNTIGKEKLNAFRFEHNMNVLNLAIDMESVEIVKELRRIYANDTKAQLSFVDHKYAKEMQAIHQVMSLGHLQMINLVLEMGASVTATMKNGLTTMHCAAQTYHGLLSMLILSKHSQKDVNLKDAKNATPLHFASMHREPKNVEYLVANGAELDIQDCQGHTPIHICMIRMIQDPDSFDEYKRIIKTLLFAGASRTVKTAQGDTASDLLEKH